MSGAHDVQQYSAKSVSREQTEEFSVKKHTHALLPLQVIVEVRLDSLIHLCCWTCSCLLCGSRPRTLRAGVLCACRGRCCLLLWLLRLLLVVVVRLGVG